MGRQRSLGAISLTTLLVSAHYGLGFVLGTGEAVSKAGAIGSLYAVAVGLGTLAMILLANFYWTRVEQIWTLLGDRYGQSVKVGVGLMSWLSLIGIGAVQIVAAAAILGIVGLPHLPSTTGLAALFCLFSLLPVERASWLFRGFLLCNIGALSYALWQLDRGVAYRQVVIDFLPAVSQVQVTEVMGVALSTILLVLVDMKCQQFVVSSRSLRVAYWGCVLAGLLLIALAFLPAAVVLAAQQAGILPADTDSKAVIPYILAWIGGGSGHFWGATLIATLAVPALGIGSNILRIQTKALLDLAQVTGDRPQQVLVAAINASCALAIALKGGEILGLILCFYAAYLAAVWVPFIAYLLATANWFTFSVGSVRWAAIASSLAALSALATSLFRPQAMWFDSPELTILAVGLAAGCLALVSVQGVEKIGGVSFLGQKKGET
jgi:SSS family solute:Na+ symporter